MQEVLYLIWDKDVGQDLQYWRHNIDHYMYQTDWREQILVFKVYVVTHWHNSNVNWVLYMYATSPQGFSDIIEETPTGSCILNVNI